MGELQDAIHQRYGLPATHLCLYRAMALFQLTGNVSLTIEAPTFSMTLCSRPAKANDSLHLFICQQPGFANLYQMPIWLICKRCAMTLRRQARSIHIGFSWALSHWGG
jgi:hypothetical protein